MYLCDWVTTIILNLEKVYYFNKKYNLIAGTKWCGGGNKADDYDDLGKYDKPDKCCRAHDKCPMSLKARTSGWGLKNYWLPLHTRYIIWY